MNAKEFLTEKGIYPSEPIYLELNEKRTIYLHELMDEFAKAYASSKMPSKGEIKEQLNSIHKGINRTAIDLGFENGFKYAFSWLKSLAKPTEKQ